MMSAAEMTNGTSAGKTRNERRRSPRYSFTAEVEIVEAVSGTKMTAHTLDFSRGGCYVDMFNPLPANTIVTVRLRKWQQTLETPAKVVYSSVGMGMGLMFGLLDATQRAVVESWLTQLSGAHAC
ncbi:MAG TPA: PilZ domain-containing protein [Candidatus Acidoferrum sp.]|nr:PilZ domain-containing protein [Candidatus Acidoferrum sp.]